MDLGLGRWFGAPRESEDVADADEEVQTRRQAAASRTTSDSRPRDVNRLQTPAELIRNRSRGNSPAASPAASPLPVDVNVGSAFEWPEESDAQPSIMDDERVQRITANTIRIALQQDREERDHQQRIATEAAVSAALANQSNQVKALRKPEIPNFDKNNIDTWIRRTENAFARFDITNPRQKFSYLERTFHIDDDPKINNFLEGETADDWKDFLSYLREIHRQCVYSLIKGTPQDNRRPSMLASHIKKRAGQATLDNIYKEVLLREMPDEVQQHAASKIKDLDFQETAKELDNYFDQKGKLINSKGASNINSVTANKQRQQSTSRPLQSAMKQTEMTANPSYRHSTLSSEATGFTAPYKEDLHDATDVNAVRFRSNGQRQQFNVRNRERS